MKILISSEHAGYELKMNLVDHLSSRGFEVEQSGATSSESTDYPPIIEDASLRVAGGEFDLGIFICGTGIGVSLAACKIPGTTVALVTNSYMARMAREHNNANVLCLGSRVVGLDHAKDIVDTFLNGSFEGGRHTRRLVQVQEIERRYRR